MLPFMGLRPIAATSNRSRQPHSATLGLLQLEDRTVPSYTFSPINVPGAVQTQVNGINDSGQIVGNYLAFTGTKYGFLLSAGNYTTLNVPGSTQTGAYGINASGQIVGFYDMAGVTHGFLLSAGTFTTIDPPSSTLTYAYKITASGQIVGQYHDASGNDHGFLLTGGTYTTLDVPGSTDTQGQGINDSLQIVGGYLGEQQHGFLLSGGNYTTYDPPGSTFTIPYAINNSGQIVGQYNSDRARGFLLSGGSYTTLEVPGSTFNNASGINASGQVVGTYSDFSGVRHGYLAISQNTPPQINAGADQIIAEGNLFTAAGSFTDPDADPWTATVNYGDGSGVQPLALNPNKTFSLSHVYADNGNYTVTLTVIDSQSAAGTDTVLVTVNNVAPVLGIITAPVNPVQVGTSIIASASFTDAGTLDTHTAVWDWGDGTSSGTVTESNGSGSVTDSHAYTSPGVYTVTLTVTDKDGSQDQSIFQYVVAYDPSAGFVTGGGNCTSPAGAYAAAPALSGKATFGFVVRYRPGATVPDGNIEFRFQPANFAFKSTGFEWLLVDGARAQVKGSGTVNGSGDYGFLLTVIDGQFDGGTGADRFRLKIWNKDTGAIVYDTQMGDADTADPTTLIDGGSIVIHRKT